VEHAALIDDRLKAHRQDFDRIPVVDIAGLRDGSDRNTPATDIHWALSNTGFMYVRGHGVTAATIDAAFTAVNRSLPCARAKRRR
jgi:isopenicillin N synthase-like dioxygenase